MRSTEITHVPVSITRHFCCKHLLQTSVAKQMYKRKRSKGKERVGKGASKSSYNKRRRVSAKRRRGKTRKYGARNYGRSKHHIGELVRTVPRGVPYIFPDVLRIKMVYCDDQSAGDFNFPITGASVGGYAWSGNNLKDPNETGVGHQPSGYDIIKARYTYNRVLASKIELMYKYVTQKGVTGAVPIRIHDNETTGTDNLEYIHPIETFMSLVPKDNASTYNLKRYEVIEGRKHDASVHAGTKSIKCKWLKDFRWHKITSYCSTAAAVGVTPDEVKGESTFRAAADADVGTEWFWVFTGVPMGENHADNRNIAVYSKITYYVQWEDPIKIAKS